MHIGIPKEIRIHENRVAATPKTVKQLLKLGFSVSIESQAGKMSHFDDMSYVQAGATIANSTNIWKADIILKVNAPENSEIPLLQTGTVLVSFIYPSQNPEIIKKLAKRGITVMAMDAVPRISRAQSLDALSSMANITGYRAVIEAAYEFGRCFMGQITAAGKIFPAKVLVIGAGVSGLSAISTAKSLGAIVYAFDTRPETKEQVESIGARFLKLSVAQKIKDSEKTIPEELIQTEKKFFAEQAKEVDIIITTALIPGQPAPKIITSNIVDTMKPGSVIVDLAVENGGNCEYTVPDEIIMTNNNVKVIGYTNLVSKTAMQSSQLYSENTASLLQLLCKNKDGKIVIDFEDVIIRCITVIRDGKITWPAPSSTKILSKLYYEENKNPIPLKLKKEESTFLWKKKVIFVLVVFLFGWFATIAPKEFLDHFTVFILSCVVGYYVVWNVTYSLHTPLMSVTNAISGIIIIGAILQIDRGGWISILSFIAVLVSSINIFGGFSITQRMLRMFHKNEKR